MKFRSVRSRQQKYKLPEAREKENYIRHNFNEIASKYDLFNDAITFGRHRRWKKITIDALSLPTSQPARVIDLCCGSGDLSLMLARTLPEGSRITAIDFSAEMLTVLKKRLKEIQLPNQTVDVMEGNIMQMEQFDNDTFDGAVIGFGLRNVLEREGCLREIQRVLKKGATLAILDVGQVSNPLIRFFHQLYFEKITPIIGALVHGKKHEMYDYLPASARTFPDQQKLAGELINLGYQNVSYRNFMFGAAALHTAQK